MIRARIFLIFITLLLATLALLFLHSHNKKKAWLKKDLQANQKLVHHLSLTDLALWTEARYTRHPALSDFFAPFQDSPATFEHFPAGSIITPHQPAVTTSLRVRHNSIGSN